MVVEVEDPVLLGQPDLVEEVIQVDAQLLRDLLPETQVEAETIPEGVLDLVTDLESESSERRQFLLRAHIGNYALWLSGLFPDYVIARVHRKAAPGLDYYENVGASGYLTASEFELADRYDLRDVYRQVARSFGGVRRALNRISDRYFFPVPTSQIDRLLRQVADQAATD